MPRNGIGLVALCAVSSIFARPCCADLIIATVNPADQTIPEVKTTGSVMFTIQNTGPTSITIATAKPEALIDSVQGQNDARFDAITNPATPTICDDFSPLIGKQLGFRQSCTVEVPFFVVDNDPSDSMNPTNDTGYWKLRFTVTDTTALAYSARANKRTPVAAKSHRTDARIYTPAVCFLPVSASKIGLVAC